MKSAVVLSAILAFSLTGCSGEPGISKQCTTNSDCATGYTCENFLCTPSTVCTPGQKSCSGSSVVECAASGTSTTTVQTCAGTCSNGACQSAMCQPGSTRCNGSLLLQCTADGTSYTEEEACSLGCDTTTNTCIQATCRPGQTRCNSTTELQTCNSNGTDWANTNCNSSGPATCTTNTLSGNSTVAFCESTSCTAGMLECQGLNIVECNNAGTGQSVIAACASGCSNGSCTAATCTPGTYQCSTDGTSVQVCNALGTGWETQACTNGSCVLTPGASGAAAAQCEQQICTPSSAFCSGDVPVQCSSNGLTETLGTSCPYGCDTNSATCLSPVCSPGQTQCDGNALQICASDQRSFVFDTYCEDGCQPGSGNTQASCVLPACSPFSTQCVTGQPTAIDQCAADGSGYTQTTCPSGLVCENNTCVSPPGQCTGGDIECSAGEIESCEGSGSSTVWVPTAGCLGQCSGQGCDSSGECGGFNLHVALAQDGATLPINSCGASSSCVPPTLLIVSDALVAPDGFPVPDGTMVTIAPDSTSGIQLESSDADTSTPGLQRPVLNGRVDFVIQPPATPGSGSVTAELAGRSVCSGTLNLNFSASVTDGYFGEDFSTTRHRLAPFSGQWDTANGTLTLSGKAGQIPVAFDAGNGMDGNLTVAAGQTVDLSTYSNNGNSYADMASANLVSASGNLIDIDTALTPFQTAGTRILVINLQGTSASNGNVGSYEYATVTGASGGALQLLAPLSNVYGNGGNSASDLTGQIVRVIRVPQYNQVQIAGTLTGPTFNGSSGGVLVFMAAASATQGGSRIYGTGTITMSGKGYRGASQPPLPPEGSTSDYPAVGNPPISGLYTGEGPAGSLNTPSTIGVLGGGGGGYQCDTQDTDGFCGDIEATTQLGTNSCSGACQHYDPSNPVGGCSPSCIYPTSTVGLHEGAADSAQFAYYGSGGSYADSGQSSCSTIGGAGQTYGSSQLTSIFMGGGSGSVSESSSHNCQAYNYPSIWLAQTYGTTAPGASYHACCIRNDNGECCENEDNTCCDPVTNTCNGGSVSCTNANYCDAWSLIWDNAYAGANGGGIVLISAAALTLSDSATVTTIGNNQSVASYGGAGGSLYLRANRLTLGGPNRLLAGGGLGGGDGRIRIDAEVIDAGFLSSWTAPAAAYVALTVTQPSNVVVTLPDTSHSLAASLVLPASASLSSTDNGFDPTSDMAASDLLLSLSEDDGVSFGVVAADGTKQFGTSPAVGTQVEWLLGATAASGSTRGLAGHFTVP